VQAAICNKFAEKKVFLVGRKTGVAADLPGLRPLAFFLHARPSVFVLHTRASRSAHPANANRASCHLPV
jgi:hypothetical protein